jgi:hypothetical protein
MLYEGIAIRGMEHKALRDILAIEDQAYTAGLLEAAIRAESSVPLRDILTGLRATGRSDYIAGWNDALDRVNSETVGTFRTEPSAEIERLRAALWKYGDHRSKCHLADYTDCDCGFHEMFFALLAPHAGASRRAALAPANAAGREDEA